MGVLDDVDIRENDQPLLNHPVDYWQDFFELFFRIHNRNHDGVVMGKMQRFLLVDSAMCTIAENAPIDRRSRKIVGPHCADQGFMQWLVLPAVTFADEDSH